MILDEIKQFFGVSDKEKHEFNFDDKITRGGDYWKKQPDGELCQLTIDGYRCIKCGRIFWLDEDHLIDLPDDLAYCDSEETHE
jgi:hypothetical protein